MMHEDYGHPLALVDDGRSPMFESEEKERGNSIRQRHDRGPRLTSRDVTCLLWSAKQKFILRKMLLFYRLPVFRPDCARDSFLLLMNINPSGRAQFRQKGGMYATTSQREAHL